MVTRLFGDLSADIKVSPEQLAVLREAACRLRDKYPEIPVWQLSPEQLATQNIPESLYPCLQRKHMAEIVMMLELTDRQFRCSSTLSESIGLPGNSN